MERFFIASGLVFSFVCLAWIVRLVAAIPIAVGSVEIPVWCSVFPIAVSGALATWALRLSAGAARRVS